MHEEDLGCVRVRQDFVGLILTALMGNVDERPRPMMQLYMELLARMGWV